MLGYNLNNCNFNINKNIIISVDTEYPNGNTNYRVAVFYIEFCTPFRLNIEIFRILVGAKGFSELQVCQVSTFSNFNFSCLNLLHLY